MKEKLWQENDWKENDRKENDWNKNHTGKRLACRNLSKEYQKKRVLKSVDLTLESGKIYGMVGRNGAGKTTLLSILSAQNPATEGTVELDGAPVWENKKALSCICFSRELSGTNALGAMKVKDYLRAAAIYYPKWDKKMAEELLREFQIEKKKRFNQLSKGMLSAVTIIVALASKAEFTFLDEPVAGLDVIAREQFYTLLLEEYLETGRTFVISTHIIEEAASVFEEVIFIKEGEVFLKENTENLLGRACYVSGPAGEVEGATAGLRVFHEEREGRKKSVTVLLEEGQEMRSAYDVDVRPISLQKLFVSLCGKERSL